jgi:hypothetical protein
MFVQHEGGITPVSVDCNVSDEGLFSNVRENGKRGLSDVQIEQEKGVPAVVVGGGPSAGDEEQLDQILKLKSEGAVVFALNNAAAFLMEHGIRPDYQIVLDARIGNVDFVRYDRADCLLLASQCSPMLFDVALERGASVRIWHPVIEGIEPHTGVDSPCLIGGGTTVGLSGLCLVYTLGFRNIHLFGYDSCNMKDKTHAYDQPMNAGSELVRVSLNDRTFHASYAMAAQAKKFPYLAEELMKLGCNLSMYGDGLLQEIMRSACKNERILTAVYDLASSPPTFDFLPFLTEAERYRAANGYDRMDVVFMPGPMFGFRDDNLPPDVTERESMLNRVCLPACRFVKSVRNVSVLKERKELEGDAFPVGWEMNKPLSHYGVKFLKNGNRVLTASEAAKREIMSRFPKRYATITLRQSDYWPERNSNLAAWKAAGEYLKDIEIEPVYIPDTHGEVSGVNAYTPAAWDLDLRLALYEGAVLNLGVANGPLALCMLSDAKYMMWKLIDPSGKAPAHRAAFYSAHGIQVGDDFGPNGKLVWEDDTRESVLKHLHEWFYGKATEAEAVAMLHND